MNYFGTLSAAGALALAALSSSAVTASAEWGAVACGTWRDSSGTARVAIGSAVNFASEAAAIARAMQECSSRGRNCTATSFSAGCGFITVGSTSNAVRCVTGTSVQDTLNKCRKGGYSCKQPIGGCLR